MGCTVVKYLGSRLAILLLAGASGGCKRGGEDGARAATPEPGPTCDDLVASSDCPAGRRCCPLPPAMVEQPMCLPSCAGKPDTFCQDLLGGSAECNPQADCCHFPKVLGR